VKERVSVRGDGGESEFLSLFCNVLIPSLNAQQLISPVALYSKKDYLYQQPRKTMIEQKFSLEKPQIEFLNRYQKYGFKDANEIVRVALGRFQLELEAQDLQESANLYAAIYQQDEELQQLTESALVGWTA
jgi:hypothetical protein